MKPTRILCIVLIAAVFLLIPLIGMQFTSEVVWTMGDFVFAGVLIIGVGLAYEFVASREQKLIYKVAVALSLLGALLLVWGNAAVGFIGSEDHPANMLYLCILIIGFLGGIITDLHPRGMAYVLTLVALVQVTIGITAHLMGYPAALILDALFATWWLASALLFLKADRASLKT